MIHTHTLPDGRTYPSLSETPIELDIAEQAGIQDHLVLFGAGRVVEDENYNTIILPLFTWEDCDSPSIYSRIVCEESGRCYVKAPTSRDWSVALEWDSWYKTWKKRGMFICHADSDEIPYMEAQGVLEWDIEYEGDYIQVSWTPLTGDKRDTYWT